MVIASVEAAASRGQPGAAAGPGRRGTRWRRTARRPGAGGPDRPDRPHPPDAAQTLRYFAAQGVAAKVISGDHPQTVAAIAAQVGLPGADRVVDARTLPEEGEALADAMEQGTVFGRVTPHQKRAMVAALQSRGHVVAMTGDGVNDALALKDADIGIAMGSGAAASRAVAQLVLLDGSFATLPSVVAEGRRVISNIERVANLFLTKTVYAFLLAILVGVFSPPLPLRAPPPDAGGLADHRHPRLLPGAGPLGQPGPARVRAPGGQLRPARGGPGRGGDLLRLRAGHLRRHRPHQGPHPGRPGAGLHRPLRPHHQRPAPHPVASPADRRHGGDLPHRAGQPGVAGVLRARPAPPGGAAGRSGHRRAHRRDPLRVAALCGVDPAGARLLRSPAAAGGIGPALRRGLTWLRERARRIGDPLDPDLPPDPADPQPPRPPRAG